MKISHNLLGWICLVTGLFLSDNHMLLSGFVVLILALLLFGYSIVDNYNKRD